MVLSATEGVSARSATHVVVATLPADPTKPLELGTISGASRTLHTGSQDPPSVSGGALCVNPSNVRTVCVSSARTDLCGGLGQPASLPRPVQQAWDTSEQTAAGPCKRRMALRYRTGHYRATPASACRCWEMTGLLDVQAALGLRELTVGRHVRVLRLVAPVRCGSVPARRGVRAQPESRGSPDGVPVLLRGLRGHYRRVAFPILAPVL
jgi:hypothetical protein